jgi:hypothetical protein
MRKDCPTGSFRSVASRNYSSGERGRRTRGRTLNNPTGRTGAGDLGGSGRGAGPAAAGQPAAPPDSGVPAQLDREQAGQRPPRLWLDPDRIERQATRIATTALAAAERTAAQLRPSALWRWHRVMTIAVLVSLIPRVLAMLGFRPALLTADSFLYMRAAVSGQLGVIRPNGYPLFLSLFTGWPHVLTLVTGLQHLMGVAIAVIVYALLRRRGLPGWAATLAAAPVLFDPREIALESYILPDTLFSLVLVIAVAVLLTRPTPRPWQCALAGLLFAYAAVLRGNGVLLVAVAAIFLLARRVGWRALVGAAAAFVIPVAGYVLQFHAETGQYNLTSSDGIFLWSRTTSFANCAVIRPPPSLRPLCPNLERPAHVPEAAPSWAVSNKLIQGSPADYLWAQDAWWRHDTRPGFNAHNNQLGLDFAISAIKAQPLGYLRSAAADVALIFTATDRPQDQFTMNFTPAPRIDTLPGYYAHYLHEYANTTQNTHPVYPYATLLFGYEQPVWFPGLLFLLIVLTGLAGVLADWRRWGGPQFLPWGLALVIIVSPALLTQTLYRYALAAVPLACLAAGMSIPRLRALRPRRAAAAGSAAPGQDQLAKPSTPSPAVLP